MWLTLRQPISPMPIPLRHGSMMKVSSSAFLIKTLLFVYIDFDYACALLYYVCRNLVIKMRNILGLHRGYFQVKRDSFLC